jgi:hypothetical protein
MLFTPNLPIMSRNTSNLPRSTIFAVSSSQIMTGIVWIQRVILVVIKNTGHDFKGRSTGKGGFALWVHHLNETRRIRHFVPKGCHTPPQDSFTVGGGVQWLTAYRRAHELNITLVGGMFGQVGSAGGWIMVRESTAFFDRTDTC